MSMEVDKLPETWQRPGSESILETLRKLRVELPVWNITAVEREIDYQQELITWERRKIISYLSSIIKSNLEWIEDEDQREEIWNQASKRLAERCGRSAMGEITRRWPLCGELGPSFNLELREPPLTGDLLGLKTWGSSYVLAQMLPMFTSEQGGFKSLSHLFGPDISPRVPVLELGSGTGLLGLAASCIWRTPVTLTDLPDIVPNLSYNVERNHAVVESMGGTVDAARLTWGSYDSEKTDIRFQQLHQYKIILVADPLYDDDHPALLAQAVHEQMSLEPEARALIMVPIRDETTNKLLLRLRHELLQRQLHNIQENEAAVQDDWGEDGQAQVVRCWWGLLERKKSTLS